MTNTYSVLNTIAAAGADLTLVGRKLNVAITPSTGSGVFPTIDYVFINDEVTIAANAEVLQVSTETFVAANSTTYKFAIAQLVGGELKFATITYTSGSSATAAEIRDALAAEVNAHTELGIVATVAGSVVTLTAVAGTPVFTVQAISNITHATTTPGEFAAGVGADLLADGIVGVLSGSNYSQYVFTYAAAAGVQMATETQNGGNVHTLYVDEGATNFAAFNTKMGEYMNAYVAGTTDANPEAVAVS